MKGRNLQRSSNTMKTMQIIMNLKSVQKYGSAKVDAPKIWNCKGRCKNWIHHKYEIAKVDATVGFPQNMKNWKVDEQNYEIAKVDCKSGCTKNMNLQRSIACFSSMPPTQILDTKFGKCTHSERRITNAYPVSPTTAKAPKRLRMHAWSWNITPNFEGCTSAKTF